MRTKVMCTKKIAPQRAHRTKAIESGLATIRRLQQEVTYDDQENRNCSASFKLV